MSEPADFDVFSTSSGLKQITNPVRQKILGELSKAELSLTDIANLTGKAQSTLSVHLDKMLKEGLVGSRDDPTDNRRKIFFLLSHPVGKSKMPNDKLREEMRQTVLSSIGDPGTFYKGLLRAMIIGMESVGLGIDPTMRMIGAEIGKALAKKISSDDTEGVISEVQEFYEIHRVLPPVGGDGSRKRGRRFSSRPSMPVGWGPTPCRGPRWPGHQRCNGS